MQGFLTSNEAAKKWNITSRQVQILCKTDRIPGAVQVSRIWLIPENAEKPTKYKSKKSEPLLKEMSVQHENNR